MARPSASMLAGLVVVLCCSIAAQASLMAIDLGSENLKVSLIKPGRTPISIVVNEMSKRKTPALVGFANGERLLGEEAASFSVRFPDTIYMRARDLLGKPHDDPSIQTMVKEHNLPYKIVPHPTRNLAAVQVKEDVIVSAEELVGSTLQYARQIAEAQSGAPVPDAVIAVPAHFGQAQRQGILDAASLVGINVLGMINTHTAAALQFGIERDFANKTQHVIFYDQGAGCTVVALVKYSSYLTKEGGASKAISQLEVRDIDWDEDLGANSLDTLLSMHFAKSFADKYKLKVDDVLGNARSMAKLKKQVRRTKEMLSANTAAPISVEEFHDGKDYQSSITREEFETMASSFFERAAAPLKRVLDRSGLKIEELDFVELLGGGTRVPKLQAALSDVLGGRALDRHVDADEAVVMGASLFAANLSTSFRLRKFGMADLTTYGVSLRVDEVHEQEVVPASTEAAAEGKDRNLLPYLKKLPVRRLVHFTNLTQDPLRVALTYNTSTPHPLPPGVKQPELATFNITGINTVINRYNSSGTVNLRFEASYDGILRLTKAEAVVDYTVNETKLVPIKVPSNTTTDNSTTTTTETVKDKAESTSSSSTVSDDGYDEPAPEGAAAAGGEEEAGEGTKEGGETKQGEGADGKSEANQGKTDEKDGSSTNTTTTEPKVEVKYENVTVTRKKTAKVALNVSISWTTPPLGGEALKAARAAITGWVAAEQTKRLTAAAKNELEAYIIKMRERVENDDKILKVTTPDQRTPFLAALAEAEDWLYMDGEGEAAKAFKDKLATLKKTGDAFENRAQEAEQRPAATSAARKEAELKTAAVGLWADSKPWITEEERKEVSDKLSAFLTWLDEKEAAQAKKAIHEDGAYTAREVASEFEKLDKAFNKIANKKKPKPPPEPPAPVNATGDGNTAGNSSETGDAPGNESKGPEDTTKESKAESSSQSNGKKEADAKAKKEAEAKAKTKKDADAAKAKREAEAKAKKEKEAKTRKEKEEKAKKGTKGGKPPPKADAGKGNKGKTTGSKKVEADDEL